MYCWPQLQSAARAPDLLSQASKDFAGQINVAGHTVYLECRGTGSPTVVLESGYHDLSQTWSLADGFPPPVLTRVAGFTRVCRYDRPGTLLYSDPPRITDRTAPVDMPRTAADVVSELHTLLAAANVPGPYILAGHSLGGLFTLLYVQTYPSDVKGWFWSTPSQPRCRDCSDHSGRPIADCSIVRCRHSPRTRTSSGSTLTRASLRSARPLPCTGCRSSC